MTLTELAQKLDEMKPGESAAIHHDVFAALFPPGEPDYGARNACYDFAREHGCQLDNQPGPLSRDVVIRFKKHA